LVNHLNLIWLFLFDRKYNFMVLFLFMSHAFYLYLDMMRVTRNIPFKSFLNEWTCSVKCAMDKIETTRFTQDDLQELVLGVISLFGLLKYKMM
jgi:hypothetical protein